MSEELPDRVVYAHVRGSGFLVTRLSGEDTYVATRSEVWSIVHKDDDVWMKRMDRNHMRTRVIWKEEKQ